MPRRVIRRLGKGLKRCCRCRRGLSAAPREGVLPGAGLASLPPHPTCCPPPARRRFDATLRRKSHPEDMLAGVAFTGFGLGDSNYTRYMYVPRSIKQRLLDLGAQQVRRGRGLGWGFRVRVKGWLAKLAVRYMHAVGCTAAGCRACLAAAGWMSLSRCVPRHTTACPLVACHHSLSPPTPPPHHPTTTALPVLQPRGG